MPDTASSPPQIDCRVRRRRYSWARRSGPTWKCSVWIKKLRCEASTKYNFNLATAGEQTEPNYREPRSVPVHIACKLHLQLVRDVPVAERQLPRHLLQAQL